ncbi:hypothetical protein [Streptomyces sp. NPDC051561]|uniref:hypothetical protein n=1 Tax=Streptomyces sp. NPDC051561 TaxID=3365658 RepID=UPI0037B5FE18
MAISRYLGVEVRLSADELLLIRRALANYLDVCDGKDDRAVEQLISDLRGPAGGVG